MSINAMKKLGLSLFVILLFIAYSFQQRQDSDASANVALNSPGTSSTGSSTVQNDTNATTTTDNTSSNASQQTTANSASIYKDGTYTGARTDAVYGFIQVKATISDGKLVNVVFLEYPNDHHESVEINQRAMPLLKQEAIQGQTARVDGVSGATDTSAAFVESLNAALTKAKA